MTAADSGGALSGAFVEKWSRRYSASYDEQVLNVIGPAVAARGNSRYFTRAEFVAVCAWKTRRTSTAVAGNAAEDVEELTQVALAAPERFRHRILTILAGVGIPTASALLMVADPERFTVIDYRSVEALQAHGELPPGWPAYMTYLQRCREIAGREGVGLRQLDRALWCWHRYHEESDDT